MDGGQEQLDAAAARYAELEQKLAKVQEELKIKQSTLEGLSMM